MRLCCPCRLIAAPESNNIRHMLKPFPCFECFMGIVTTASALRGGGGGRKGGGKGEGGGIKGEGGRKGERG